ncbi:unnamed protein product [Adineta steineri]|uniref:G-protein coupled receptors family 1 profile domain-containing protein n=1 Tax=Adineta steineri TaxID=433720 RepID=A0A816E725_9BILA|nr:unnamed protein product [Adineta steineri]CAF1648588.1 unnamed protein product [Adineta steineri]
MNNNLDNLDFMDNASIYTLSTPNENNSFILILSILLFIVLLIGLIGNILVIYVVLNYGRLKTVTNTYLLHLALSDLVFLSGVPFFISSIITRSWIFGSIVCKIFFLTQGVNQYTSIIILALLSFDRYLAVCHSTKSIVWRSRVNPNILLIFVWILSFVLMLPIIIFTSLQETAALGVQCTIILPLVESRLLYFIYVAYTATITFFIPLTLMIFFHIMIVYRLQYKIPKQHRRSRSSMSTRRKVTILVLVVITIHLLCCSPYWTFQMFMTSELLPQTSGLLIPTSSIAQFLLFVNSSINPILYAFISEIFRTSFKRVFSCCLITNNQEFLQEKTIINRNMMLTINKNNYSQTNITRKILINNNNNNNQTNNINYRQYLSIGTNQTDRNLLCRQNRFSSLAPTASIFVSEVSIASDIQI